MMGKYLLALSGARSDILDQCDTERLKFQSLGWAILITSVMATVSMWFALNSAIGVNAFVALLAALLWGLIILGIDRWLVTSMPIDGSRRWPIALPRLVLAILLGTLISTPLVLRIFQGEINTQIAVIKEQRANTFLSSQQNSTVNSQVTHWTNAVNNLEKVINSRGNVPLNPSADPVVQSLTKQRTTALALKQKYYGDWQCQLYGGAGCTKKGNGPLAGASHQSYLQAAAQVTTIDKQIQQREATLSADDAASQQTRYQQAVSALPTAKTQLKTAMAAQDALRNNFESNNIATNGVLIRLQALNELSDRDFTLNSARFLLFLLFLVIECLPVTVKLMQRPGVYERILRDRAEMDLKNARRALRNQTRPSVAGAPASAGDVREPREQVIDQIWRQPRTRVTEMPSWRSSDETARIDRSDDPGEDAMLDTAIRDMPDAHRVMDTDRRRGGIELRYGDDDL
jgi:hypothetical protein